MQNYWLHFYVGVCIFCLSQRFNFLVDGDANLLAFRELKMGVYSLPVLDNRDVVFRIVEIMGFQCLS